MLKKVIKKELGIRKMFPKTAKTRGKFLSSVFFYVVSFSARNSEYVFTFLLVRWRLLVRLPNKNKLELFLLLALALHVAEVHLVAAGESARSRRRTLAEEF